MKQRDAYLNEPKYHAQYNAFIQSALDAGFTDPQINWLEHWVFDNLFEPEN